MSSKGLTWAFKTLKPVCVLSHFTHGLWTLQHLTVGGLVRHLLPQPVGPLSPLGLRFPAPALCGIDYPEGLEALPRGHPLYRSCCLRKLLGLPPQLRVFPAWPSPLASLFLPPASSLLAGPVS